MGGEREREREDKSPLSPLLPELLARGRGWVGGGRTLGSRVGRWGCVRSGRHEKEKHRGQEFEDCESRIEAPRC